MRFILLLLLLAASTGAIAQHAGPEVVSNDKKTGHPVNLSPGVYVSPQGDTPTSTPPPTHGIYPRFGGRSPMLVIDGKPASDMAKYSAGNGIAICTDGMPVKKELPELTKPVPSRPVVKLQEGKQADTSMVRNGVVIVK